MSLGKLSLIDTPFKRVAVDIVGPIEPCSEIRNRYILVTMIDYATRYPEAVALPSIYKFKQIILQSFWDGFLGFTSTKKWGGQFFVNS